MLELKRVIAERSDAEIAEYVKTVFAPKLDAYIEVLRKAQEVQDHYLVLLTKSAERELALEQLLVSAGMMDKGVLS